MAGSLDGRVALVTGGSSGIGLATAHVLAREGARIVIAARGVERGEEALRALEAAGAEAIFVPTDVARADQVEALVAATVGRFGRLDVAVNNAATGEVGMFRPTADYTEEEFDRALAFNLKSVWLCLKHEIVQLLRQGGGGAIVNTSSVNGLGGVAGGALYAAAKAGVLGLTKSAAQEYAQQRIRVNALVAGGFRTPMLEGVFLHYGGGDVEQARAVEAQLSRQIPMGRIGAPAEAAEAIAWLCSDRAAYVTGHSMIVDGGLTSTMR
jgi:NAD(P)-dependent dehydrogenase (short-subunit alcohol dehydrogenase family)